MQHFLVENGVEVGKREVEEAMVLIRFFATQMNLYEKRCELMTQELKTCREVFHNTMVS